MATCGARRHRAHASLLPVLLVASASLTAAHGSGAWRDPNHFDEGVPFAGTRYIAEVSHKLTVVGTDDGKTWWTVKGWCEGVGMKDIHIDFSPKGGPADAAAKWAKDANGAVTLTFGDGNAWQLIMPTSDSVNVPPGSLVSQTPAATLRPNASGLGMGLIASLLMFSAGYFVARRRGAATPFSAIP